MTARIGTEGRVGDGVECAVPGHYRYGPKTTLHVGSVAQWAADFGHRTDMMGTMLMDLVRENHAPDEQRVVLQVTRYRNGGVGVYLPSARALRWLARQEVS